ncbi:MAG: hypothetical protein K2W95_13185 [Candidatus Obscuribacterales bacterium]|nr:hypothetical protein [Candidatus Obscuribacterales bacterium]
MTDRSSRLRLHPSKFSAVATAAVGAILLCLFCLPSLLVRITQQCAVVSYEPSRTIEPGFKLDPRFWLQNIDEPMPPSTYLPSDSARVDKWYWRNPFHNFTFYVIGVADQRFQRVGLCPRDTFNPADGWNWCVSSYGPVELPLLSFRRGKLQVYFGWRDRGNFGIKFNW